MGTRGDGHPPILTPPAPLAEAPTGGLRPGEAPTGGLRPGEAPTGGLRPGEAPTGGLRPGEAPTGGLRPGEALAVWWNTTAFEVPWTAAQAERVAARCGVESAPSISRYPRRGR
ncbi:hypothetical protein [Streptomyces sp. HNM1019]|uniref:hypothetical protein n=1 Tax=Streptomyces sp. HNM1019 TaxID=3424717 RepID=UPI003D7738AF